MKPAHWETETMPTEYDHTPFFVNRPAPFADGTPDGVDVYKFSPSLSAFSCVAALGHDVAVGIYGDAPRFDAVPEGLRLSSEFTSADWAELNRRQDARELAQRLETAPASEWPEIIAAYS